MQPPRETPSAPNRLLPFVRFAADEGWKICRSKTGNLRFPKAGLPPIHIGLGISDTTGEIPTPDNRPGGTDKQEDRDA